MDSSVVLMNDDCAVETYNLYTHASWPNNTTLPLAIYRSTILTTHHHHTTHLADHYEQLLHRNSWYTHRRDGMYGVHHYHSQAHECLAVYAGTATIQFGSDSTDLHTDHTCTVQVTAGDVIVIPAGVAHHSLDATADFMMCGGYPVGQQRDICYVDATATTGIPAMVHRVHSVPLPDMCPIFGQTGKLNDVWGLYTSTVQCDISLRLPNATSRAVSVGNIIDSHSIRQADQLVVQ